jgi:hypothetical protein
MTRSRRDFVVSLSQLRRMVISLVFPIHVLLAEPEEFALAHACDEGGDEELPVLAVRRGEERADLVDPPGSSPPTSEPRPRRHRDGFAPTQSPARVASLNMRRVIARRSLRDRGSVPPPAIVKFHEV